MSNLTNELVIEAINIKIPLGRLMVADRYVIEIYFDVKTNMFNVVNNNEVVSRSFDMSYPIHEFNRLCDEAMK